MYFKFLIDKPDGIAWESVKEGGRVFGIGFQSSWITYKVLLKDDRMLIVQREDHSKKRKVFTPGEDQWLYAEVDMDPMMGKLVKTSAREIFRFIGYRDNGIILKDKEGRSLRYPSCSKNYLIEVSDGEAVEGFHKEEMKPRRKARTPLGYRSLLRCHEMGIPAEMDGPVLLYAHTMPGGEHSGYMVSGRNQFGRINLTRYYEESKDQYILVDFGLFVRPGDELFVLIDGRYVVCRIKDWDKAIIAEGNESREVKIDELDVEEFKLLEE